MEYQLYSLKILGTDESLYYLVDQINLTVGVVLMGPLSCLSPFTVKVFATLLWLG